MTKGGYGEFESLQKQFDFIIKVRLASEVHVSQRWNAILKMQHQDHGIRGKGVELSLR